MASFFIVIIILVIVAGAKIKDTFFNLKGDAHEKICN